MVIGGILLYYFIIGLEKTLTALCWSNPNRGGFEESEASAKQVLPRGEKRRKCCIGFLSRHILTPREENVYT